MDILVNQQALYMSYLGLSFVQQRTSLDNFEMLLGVYILRDCADTTTHLYLSNNYKISVHYKSHQAGTLTHNRTRR